MSKKRSGIGDKLRFEVFKRDAFKCQYCGRTSPEVTLVIDHIKPAVSGGTDGMLNLITACVECNSGKGAIPLSDDSAIAKQRKQLEDLNERRLQLEMMLAWQTELDKLHETALNAAVDRFEQCAGVGVTDVGKSMLQKLIKKYTIAMVLSAVETSVNQYLPANIEDLSERRQQECREKVFQQVGKICYWTVKNGDKPWMKDLYYTRGILRNTCNFGKMSQQDHIAIDLMVQAYDAGVTLAEITELAKTAETFERWSKDINTSIVREDNRHE